jgi:hypothetical protein
MTSNIYGGAFASQAAACCVETFSEESIALRMKSMDRPRDLWRRFREDPLGNAGCWILAALICAVISVIKDMPTEKILDLFGTALVFAGTVWMALGVRIKPRQRRHFMKNVAAFRGQADKNHRLSDTELRALELTCAELCEALLSASRFTTQGLAAIILGSLLLLKAFLF